MCSVMWSYRLDPWPQVRRTLVETRVLDEMAFTFLTHDPTVVPVKVVQVRVIFMSFSRRVRSATGVLMPRGTLREKKERREKERRRRKRQTHNPGERDRRDHTVLERMFFFKNIY